MLLISFSSAYTGYNMYGSDNVNSYSIHRLDNDSYKVVYDSGVKYYDFNDYFEDRRDISYRPNFVRDKNNDDDKDDDSYSFRERSFAEEYWKNKYYGEKKSNYYDKVVESQTNEMDSYSEYYSSVFGKYFKVKCYNSAPAGKIFYRKC